MNETAFVLQVIHDELDKADPEIVGRLDLTNEALTVLDGKAKLSAIVHHDPESHATVAHCHVTSDIADDQSGHLDACLVGFDPKRPEALANAARIWAELVAGPVFSLMHARPVMGASHFDGSQPEGVAGCHGFVGPICARLFEGPFDLSLFEGMPIFDYVSEMAPPGTLHLAKVTLEAKGKAGWKRNVEINGHADMYVDDPWRGAVLAPPQGIVSQFAVFHHADQAHLVEQRQFLDDAIRRFVSAFQTTDDTDVAAKVLACEGVEADLVDRIVTFSPIAFGRVVFESLVASFASDYIRVTRDGTIQDDLHLMHEPVFARSMMLSHEFMASAELLEAFKRVALTGSEIAAVNNALYAGSKTKDLQLLPPIVPDPGAPEAAIARALQQMESRAKQNRPMPDKRKPWWRFW